MALFSRKTADPAPVAEGKTSAPALNVSHFTAGSVLRPHLSEKSVGQGDARVYTFLVAKNATKSSVKSAIAAIYQVTPVKVNIVNKSPRTALSRTRNRPVTQSGYKKAYVYLKPGDSINLI